MELIILLIFLLITFYSGKRAETKHYTLISEEEQVVLWADYFRNFVAGFIHLFGWRLSVYESLLDRARREAMNRAKKICKEKWYNCLTHLRYETTVLSSTKRKAIPQIEVFVYAAWTTVTL